MTGPEVTTNHSPTVADGAQTVNLYRLRATNIMGASDMRVVYDRIWGESANKGAPAIANLMGYASPAKGEISFPTIDQLNEAKAALPSDIGINDGVFVEVDDGKIPHPIYLGHLAVGEIPMSAGKLETSRFAVHDRIVHAIGFGILHQSIFDFMKKRAQRAVKNGRTLQLEHAARLVDNLSAFLTFRLPLSPDSGLLSYEESLNDEYSEFMSSFFAGKKAHRDFRRQRAIVDALTPRAEDLAA